MEAYEEVAPVLQVAYYSDFLVWTIDLVKDCEDFFLDQKSVTQEI